MARKGFPESYDRRELLRFLTAVKSVSGPVDAPVYSHLTYDIVPDSALTVDSPDILLLEGLNVLQPAQPAATGHRLAVSDFIDFSIYVDAAARTSGAGTSNGSCGCGRPRSATRPRSSAATPSSIARPPSRRRSASGTRSTGRTWS